MRGILLLSWAIAVLGCTSVSLSLPQDNSRIARNPFRGFMSYSLTDSPKNRDFPSSLEYTYILMSDVNPSQGQYDWTTIESKLNEAANRGNHLVFRIYIDYPGETFALPTYLTQGNNPVKLTSYTAYGSQSTSPDYSNPRLITAMTGLIQALGAKYDGDVRIAAVELGLLGFYGEWHCYIDGTASDPAFASRSVQLAVLNAWNTSFTVTPLVNSQDEYQYWTTSDAAGSQSGSNRYPNIGRFDDNWGVQTYLSSTPDNADFFYARTKAAGDFTSWQKTMRGGEVQPAIQSTQFADNTKNQPFVPAVQALHASWLLNYYIFDQKNNPTYNNTLKASLSLGYNFHLSTMVVSMATDNTALGLQACVVNTGVAPFYYPLSLYASLDQGTISTFSGSPNSFGGNSTVCIKATLPLTKKSVTSSIAVWLNSSHVMASNPLYLSNSGPDSQGRLNFALIRDDAGGLVSVNGVAASVTDGKCQDVAVVDGSAKTLGVMISLTAMAIAMLI